MLKKLLFSSSQKQVVGVALTPGLGLEVAVYDRSKNTVLKYGRKKVEYNFSTREIQDLVEFKSALGDLISELNIQPKAAAHLVLPNVYFDFLEIPSSITESEIQTVLLSKAEEFYLFKKEEPVSGWCNVANIEDPTQKRLAFTSFQKSVVESIKDIFSDVGLQLVGIESAYTATVRGLHLVGLVDKVIQKKDSWTVISVNTNSFTILYFDADNFLNFHEVPIAIKSFSQEEVYDAIASSASQFLNRFSFSKLFIVSQTDDISASKLRDIIDCEVEIEAINTNQYSEKPIVEILESSDFKLANSMTFGVIGASVPRTELGLTTNVLNDSEGAAGVYCTTVILGTVVEVTDQVIMKICLFIALVCFLILGGLALVLHTIGNNLASQIETVTSEINTINSQIEQENAKPEPEKTIDMNEIIDEVANINVEAIKFYDSISNDIPKNIWLTKYYNNLGNKIVISGVAENITDIYEYYKNLKVISPESDIKLNGLQVITGGGQYSELLKGLAINPEKDRLYSFEISNTKIGFDLKERLNQATNEEIIIKPLNGDGPTEELSEQLQPAE